MSVRPFKWNNSAPTERILMKFGIWIFLENLSRKGLKSETNDGYFTWSPKYIYDKISLNSRWNGKRFRQCRRENKKSVQNFFRKIVPFFEIMWKKCGRALQTSDDNLIRRMHLACWMIKDTNTHSECVILSFSTATMVTRTHLIVTFNCLVNHLN